MQIHYTFSRLFQKCRDLIKAFFVILTLVISFTKMQKGQALALVTIMIIICIRPWQTPFMYIIIWKFAIQTIINMMYPIIWFLHWYYIMFLIWQNIMPKQIEAISWLRVQYILPVLSFFKVS